MPTNIFVNLPVTDLQKSKEFFSSLGYGFNPQFTNDDAASLVISDTIYVMLVSKPFFAQFTKKPIAESSVTEVLVCVSVNSKEEVDAKANQAVASGGKIHRDPQDYGWMYTQSIEDLDGHIWEFAWMDQNHVQK